MNADPKASTVCPNCGLPPYILGGRTSTIASTSTPRCTELFARIRFFRGDAVAIRVIFLRMARRIATLTSRFRRTTTKYVILFITTRVFHRVSSTTHRRHSLCFQEAHVIFVNAGFDCSYFFFFCTWRYVFPPYVGG